jgi:signal transduction histidine kinase
VGPEERLRGLVLAADADRRSIERELHGGVQQYLVALATTVQLARRAAGPDPAAVDALLDEMERDVRRALDETARLAQRVYPATLEHGGLAALLRSAAVQAGVPASVDVSAGSNHAPEVALTVYLCWLAALSSATAEGKVTISVSEADDTLRFELAVADLEEFDRLRDRVEALGGRLTMEPGRLSGSLPLRA